MLYDRVVRLWKHSSEPLPAQEASSMKTEVRSVLLALKPGPDTYMHEQPKQLIKRGNIPIAE